MMTGKEIDKLLLCFRKKRKFIRCVTTQRRQYSDQEDYFKCAFPSIVIPDVNVVDYVTKNFGKWPNKIAVECGITGRKYTYDQLRKKSENFSKSLRKTLQLQRGDVVAIQLPNIPEYPICTLGILLAGLRITTINPVYTPDEIRRQLFNANPKAIITLNEYWNNTRIALDNLRRHMQVVIIKYKSEEIIASGQMNFFQLAETKVDAPDVEPLTSNEIIHLPYSSGTTGMPKGVMLSSNNIVANIAQFHSPYHGFLHEATETHQDVLPTVLPMFHIFGFTLGMLASLQKGCKLVTLPKFTPDVFLNVLNVHRPNVMQLVPPMVIFLNSYQNVKKEYLENVRTILSGAAPLGALDEDKFRERVGKPVLVLQGYGLTETAPSVMATPVNDVGKFPGSMGHPLVNTDLKVINVDDPEAKHLGPNKIGELLIRGPQVMKGYFNKPKETEEAFIDGWFRSGDLVRYDENGMFYIADRIKELIKVKGFQVPPAELEEIIRDFPGVAEAAVIGIPHDYSGEIPRAYVVPKTGQRVDPIKLQEFVQSKVAPYKKLAGGVAVVDNIPKTASGKILRRHLKEEYKQNGV